VTVLRLPRSKSAWVDLKKTNTEREGDCLSAWPKWQRWGSEGDHIDIWRNPTGSSTKKRQHPLTGIFPPLSPFPRTGLFRFPILPTKFTMQNFYFRHIKMSAHIWSTKCRWNKKLIIQFCCTLRDEHLEPN
jgi:hypothetical protein